MLWGQMSGQREGGRKKSSKRREREEGEWQGTEREEVTPHGESGRGTQKGLKGKEKEEC